VRAKSEIKANVEDALLLNSSGIVALFEERWVTDVDTAMALADKVTKEAGRRPDVAAAGGSSHGGDALREGYP
jgi:hypothetical protein